jgi:hypothetical protein
LFADVIFVLPSGASATGKLGFFFMVSIAVLLWVMLVFLLLRHPPVPFEKQQRAAVIAFIEKRLCSLY